MDNLINEIDKYKKDKENYILYIDAFCSSDKVKEVYKDNEEFELLQKYIEENNKKEQEY